MWKCRVGASRALSVWDRTAEWCCMWDVHGIAWYGMVWYGMVWCGVVWCGVVWCGVVWCGVVWCGVVWCGVVWCGVVWCGVVWCGVVWDGVGWCGMVWDGVGWCGMVWCGVVWCGVVWCGVVWCGVVWCGVVRRGAVQCGLVWYGGMVPSVHCHTAGGSGQWLVSSTWLHCGVQWAVPLFQYTAALQGAVGRRGSFSVPPYCREQWAVGLLLHTATLHGAVCSGCPSVHRCTIEGSGHRTYLFLMWICGYFFDSPDAHPRMQVRGTLGNATGAKTVP